MTVSIDYTATVTRPSRHRRSRSHGLIPLASDFGPHCLGKRSFPSKKQAVGALRVLLRTVDVERADLMNAYNCKSCRRWHLGHRTKYRPN